MDLNLVNGIIFDVDGTLYSQKKVRLSMFIRLLFYYLIRPIRIREILVVSKFRRLREASQWKDAELGAICQHLSETFSMRYERVKKTIEYWMFKNPLDLLCKYAYRDVVAFANHAKDKGLSVIIYSDYPADDKLEVLGMPYDKVFCFGQPNVDEQKPSEKVMKYIISACGVSPERLLYVGDRDDKDRVSADLVRIRYFDVQELRKQLRMDKGKIYVE